LALALTAAIASAAAHADVPAPQQAEVAHLIEFVRMSGCELERNGRRYDSREAVEQIQKKYRHFREAIHSTEDFIAFAASRSDQKSYVVHCPEGSPVQSADWLQAELRRYRGTSGKPR
jgi:hypothetical protein